MQAKKQPKHKHAAALGGVFILLAVIGAISLGFWAIRFSMNLLDNSRQKERLEHILTPIVMFDPVPFTDPAKVDNTQLLLYSMWSCLSSDKALTYNRSEVNKTLLVPASDLDAALFSMFRDRAALEHKTFRDINDTAYFYDVDTNTYEVPTYGFYSTPRPVVYDIIKSTVVSSEEGNYYDVLVQYLPPENAWQTIYVGNADIYGSKKAAFIMHDFEGVWFIDSMYYINETGEYEGVPTVDDNSTAQLGLSADTATTTSHDQLSLPSDDIAQSISEVDSSSSTTADTETSTDTTTSTNDQ